MAGKPETWPLDQPLPSDRIVAIKQSPRLYIWGCDCYRAEVFGCRKTWHWRTWDVNAPGLRGPGTLGNGTAKTLAVARRFALDVLREATGLREAVEGQETTD